MEHGGRVFLSLKKKKAEFKWALHQCSCAFRILQCSLLHIDIGQLELARQQNKNKKSSFFFFFLKNYSSDMWHPLYHQEQVSCRWAGHHPTNRKDTQTCFTWHGKSENVQSCKLAFFLSKGLNCLPKASLIYFNDPLLEKATCEHE